MTIKYPTKKSPNVDELMECALSHPTFFDGLNWLMTYEHERAREQFLRHGGQETLFSFFIRDFTRRWHESGMPIDLLNDIGYRAK